MFLEKSRLDVSPARFSTSRNANSPNLFQKGKIPTPPGPNPGKTFLNRSQPTHLLDFMNRSMSSRNRATLSLCCTSKARFNNGTT